MRGAVKSLLVAILRAEAAAVLRKYNPKVVAVTGSVGKTSTKDAIYSVLAPRYRTRKSEKSFNSELGLPLTILGAPNAWYNPLRWIQNIVDGALLLVFDSAYPEWLVLEVGADRPGDIRSLSSWLKSDVVVITRLPETPVHVEFFDSAAEVVEEKASLIDTLRPGGTLLLYGDDPQVAALAHREPAPDARVMTFGFGHTCDVRGGEVTLLRAGGNGLPVGMQAHIHVAGTSIPTEVVGALGAHAALPLIAAAAVGHALGISPALIGEGLHSYQAPSGRMRLLPGIKGSLVIDDTYNSSPAAVHAALDTLKDIHATRAIAVLGDMTELGRKSIDEHRKVGAQVAQTCQLLVTVGFRARDIAQAALDNGMADTQVLQYEDSARAGDELKNMVQEGDVVLCKGSQVMRMERIVEQLMLEPEHAQQLLVRQDTEWKKR